MAGCSFKTECACSHKLAGSNLVDASPRHGIYCAMDDARLKDDAAPRDEAAGASPWSGERVKFAALALITAITLYLTYLVFLPFASAIIWAIALAIVSEPIYRWIRRYIGNANAAAGVAVVVVLLLIVLPLIFLGQQVAQEAAGAVSAARSPEARAQLMAKAQAIPGAHRVLDYLQQRGDLRDQVNNVVGRAGAMLPALFSNSLQGITQLSIALFALFFLLRDKAFFLNAVRALIPISGQETGDVFARVKATIEASVRGRIVIAAIQGALGTIIFWILGMQGALLWGAVMAIFATIPVLGAFIVWVPAALFLLITGHAVKALILTLWGALVIGTADNLLYPMLVGKNLQMHTLLIFFSVLGGVTAFGVVGLVLGPVVVALAQALIGIWGERSGSENGEVVGQTRS